MTAARTLFPARQPRATAPRSLFFGELLLRLSPPRHELLLQTPQLHVWVGGAEANVATQLACLGHDVGFASRVPDNDLGRAGITALRGHGVDVRHIQSGGERMGLYFATPGAGLRATDIVYDRAGSAFAEAPAGAWDWDAMLAGVDHLHLSGITPALGPVPAETAIAAARAAAARDITVSFDGNWRSKLWARWQADPRTILSEIVEHAAILFGDHRDIALLLDREFAGSDAASARAACDAAFAAFPKLEVIASTSRRISSTDTHHLAARIATRSQWVQTPEMALTGIVDRIGGGDAFAAGVLDMLLSGGDADAAAGSGLALAALKHSLPGDASLFRRADLDAFAGGPADVRR